MFPRAGGGNQCARRVRIGVAHYSLVQWRENGKKDQDPGKIKYI